MNDLQEIVPSETKMKLVFNYAPIGIGKLRLLLHVEHALRTLKKLGFTKKDVDEVKGIFSDTNVYLLCGTIFVSSIHVRDISMTDELRLRYKNCGFVFRFYSTSCHSKMT